MKNKLDHFTNKSTFYLVAKWEHFFDFKLKQYSYELDSFTHEDIYFINSVTPTLLPNKTLLNEKAKLTIRQTRHTEPLREKGGDKAH